MTDQVVAQIVVVSAMVGAIVGVGAWILLEAAADLVVWGIRAFKNRKEPRS